MSNFERKKTTPCAGCMQAIKWVPVIFIASVIVWSYYAYVVQLCILAIENTFEKIVFLIFYHIICVLFFWSYWSTVFTPVGTVPSNWRIPESEIERLFRAESQEQQKRILENFAKDLPVTNRTLNGSVRFCDKCKIIKPDRAHHCSVCGTCVLKMDHHCPWVNNCVNFTNYKFFVLFLGYALLYCLYVSLTSLEYFIRFWRGELTSGMGRFHILFLFFVSIMFAISLVSLFGYHIYLVLMNRTTLEAFRAPIFRIGGADKNGFNLGKYANFQEVFGDNWKLWFLPVYTSMGDGRQYPTSSQQLLSPTTYHSMDDTRNRPELQPTDKLINTATTDAIMNSTKNDDQHLSTIVIDMNHDQYDLNNSNGGGGGVGGVVVDGEGVVTPNGNVILNMDMLNANNTTNFDTNSNSTAVNNVVEIHART
ncbi:palmitoyltransferase ZDHHC15B isoform X2 [Lucilia cuprina]|uniref:palmitoyltransferase ZDHHC15B isoform X2 n=1 Tax=Lucilia cuprina TaxID=7375 RepID=UPI001F05BBF1|nr:palmitoyltransferase ZDHHC15B isoform X2 [Lucilia cuprina]